MGRGRSSKKPRSQLLMLLVLLGILGGAGTWNYQRNLAAEAKEVRPYRTLSDADLETLIQAHVVEIDKLTARYESASHKRASGGSDRWAEFEKVQRQSRAVREIGYRLSERQAALEELQREKKLRAGEGDELAQFLKRLFTVRT